MRTRRRVTFVALQVLCVVAFLWLWQFASDSGWIRAFEFGRPSDTWHVLTTWWSDGTLWQSCLSTIAVLLLGWGVGTAVGIAVGVLMGISPFVRDVLGPFLDFVNALPRLILQPFVVIWLGFGLPAKVVFVVLVIWIVVVVAIAEGARQIPREILDNVTLLGASRWRTLRDVYAPSLGLWVVASSRTTFGFAFQGAVLAEFAGENQGLGFLVVTGQNTFQVNEIYAALTLVVVIAILGNLLLSSAESRVTRWMPATRTAAL